MEVMRGKKDKSGWSERNIKKKKNNEWGLGGLCINNSIDRAIHALDKTNPPKITNILANCTPHSIEAILAHANNYSCLNNSEYARILEI
jgi:hypothetical protein